MSKDSISKSYMNESKATYLTNPNPPLDRRVLVVGVAPENIGEQILATFIVHGIKAVDLRGEAESLDDMQDLSLFDTVVFCNAENSMDWIENQNKKIVEDVVYNSLTASIIGTQMFVAATIDKPYQKQIVFIGSMAYKSVLNASAPYCAAKAGLHHFAKCVAWELAPKNYNVYIVHPSNTENSPMTEATIEGIMRYRGVDREAAEGYWGAVLPRSRWLQKQDIANVVYDLCGGRWAYASGSAIELAGGQR